MIFSQLLANGIIAGSLYALIAVGFSLIYTTNRFLHFAHGSVAIAGGYMLYTLFDLWGVNFYLSAVLVVVLTGLLGCLLFAAVYRPLQKKKSASTILLIAGLGLLLLLENIISLIFGADVKTIDFLTVAEGRQIWGAYITPLQMVIVGTSVVFLGLVSIFIYKTKIGKIIRAVADNPELASVTGIAITRIQYLGFFIGSALSGVAGILIALEQNIEPSQGVYLMIKGFTGAVIGGVSSIPGALLGSYVLGLVENFGIWYLPSQFKDAIAFGFLLLFLLLRPYGILGINKGTRQ